MATGSTNERAMAVRRLCFAPDRARTAQHVGGQGKGVRVPCGRQVGPPAAMAGLKKSGVREGTDGLPRAGGTLESKERRVQQKGMQCWGACRAHALGCKQMRRSETGEGSRGMVQSALQQRRAEWAPLPEGRAGCWLERHGQGARQGLAVCRGRNVPKHSTQHQPCRCVVQVERSC